MEEMLRGEAGNSAAAHASQFETGEVPAYFLALSR
jgi:hypothetical protein